MAWRKYSVRTSGLPCKSHCEDARIGTRPNCRVQLRGLRRLALDTPPDACSAIDEIGKAGMRQRRQRRGPGLLRRVRGIEAAPAQSAAMS